MRSWKLAALLFLSGLGLGLLLQALSSPLHGQGSDVVYLLRSIDRRLESIERRLGQVERSVDNPSRNFDYVCDWNAVGVRVVR